MLEALLVSTIVLWLTVLVLAAVVVALVRQVGVLNERVAPAGALLGADGPRVGEAAPRLELRDWAGRSLRVGGPDTDGRSTLLLFVSPSCPVCKTILPIVDSVLRAEGGRTRLLLASDGPRAEHEAFVRRHGLDERGYVLSTELGLAYQVGKLPHAVLIDAAGVLRAKGLVNTREHVDSLFEAMARGVASVQEYLRHQQADAVLPVSEGGR
ncbi:MAG: methylamine dehydrogenase accessory protein MauD [Candidatus Binatia bacterium]